MSERQGGARRRYRLNLRGREVELGPRTWIVGVLNVTPDSFSDGGLFEDTAAAVRRGLALFQAGADIVDVGGESTRPSAAPVDEGEERRRVVPVIRALREAATGFLSVDTTKASVAEAALAAGADLVNDVSGFSFDPELPRLVAQYGVPVVLMHLRGTFATMHRAPRYDDVAAEVAAELSRAVARAERAGVRRGQIVLDPGIGFAKDASHSLELLRRLPELEALDRPLLVGPSRKSFIGKALGGAPPDRRLMGTAAAVAVAVMGGAHVVRVHDIAEMADVVRVCDAIREGAPAIAPAPAAETA